MKFEKLYSHDWCIQIGDSSGENPICIELRYFTRQGFRLNINFYTDKLIKIFGFNQKVIGI